MTGLDHVQIRTVFDQCFLASHGTRLLGGAAEPLFKPADEQSGARLYFREDFAASALHEAAHWCIAGPERRQRVDFGYHYESPPRSAQAQEAFFAAELRTQSLEQQFARAAGIRFCPSADNLTADLTEFSQRLNAQQPLTERWLESEPGERARLFLKALTEACREHG